MNPYQKFPFEAHQIPNSAVTDYQVAPPKQDVIGAIRTQIVNARENLDLTQGELASKTGVTQGSISLIEKGTGNPTVGTLQKLADGLGKHLVIRFADPVDFLDR